MPAAEAAEAARAQGKFWEMHDLLFANQQQLGPQKYEEWAAQLKLNMPKFKAFVAGNKGDAYIKKDMAEGAAVGANGTPTFFINCREIVGAQPFDNFKSIIDQEVKKADAMLKGKKPDAKFYEKICEENVKAAPTPPTPTQAGQGAPGQPRNIPVRPDDPMKGNPKAKVTIAEFSDFQ